jgi:hypothetical protein
MTSLSSSGNKRRAFFGNLMLGLILAFAALAVAGRAFGVHLHALASILLVATLIVSILHFRSLDEAAKQAHYVAWLWGSMTVMAGVGVTLAVLYAAPRPVEFPVEALVVEVFGDAAPGTVFLAGFITAPLLMVVGFGAFWSMVWLRRGG